MTTKQDILDQIEALDREFSALLLQPDTHGDGDRHHRQRVATELHRKMKRLEVGVGNDSELRLRLQLLARRLLNECFGVDLDNPDGAGGTANPIRPDVTITVEPAVLPYLAAGTKVRLRLKGKLDFIDGTVEGPYMAGDPGEVVLSTDDPVYGPKTAIRQSTVATLEIVTEAS
jgi:hypothetical protein